MIIGGRGLSRVMMRLPSLRRDLQARYRSDAELRLLCDAYEDAHEALEHRQRSVARMTAEISEYAHLIGDLEADIRRRLMRSKRDPQTSEERPGDWASPGVAARRLIRRIQRLVGDDKDSSAN
jgi:hypothetical protein